MYDLVVCAVFKNEGHILEEWLTHYFARGVDHIYLVNDESTDNFLEIVNKFKDKVTLFHNDIVPRVFGLQPSIYEKFFRSALSTTRWMAILDLDEFMYSPTTLDLKEVIGKEMVGVSQLLVHWVHFGSSGYLDTPKSAVHSFLMRANYGSAGRYESYKAIFEASSLIKFDIHSCEVTGPTKHIALSDSAPLLINHYAIQSVEFWTKIKGTRGELSYDPNMLPRNLNTFNLLDINTILDDRLSKQSIFRS
jgi:hypothetical protein